MNDKIRKIFDVVIHQKERPVYDIDGKEHAGYNDVPKNWWIYTGPKLPSDCLPDPNESYWDPFSSSINRRLWEINFKQTNTSKEKWGGTQYSNTTIVEMRCNGKPVYSFNTIGNSSGLSYALSKVEYLMTQLVEHPYNFFDTESERGRKIWWHGLPAFVDPSRTYPGEIRIIPDYSCGLNKGEWWAELRRRESKWGDSADDDWDERKEQSMEESMEDDMINWGDALSDGYINWFR